MSKYTTILIRGAFAIGYHVPAHNRKVVAMKIKAVLVVLLLLPIGCATLEERSRMDKFRMISESFERSLRTSDFSTAARYLDASAKDNEPDLKRLRNFKIADYRVTRFDVSEDKLQITQDVELQYFRLNGNILHSTRYPQTWRFHPEQEIWLLQTGLPDLGSQHSKPRRR
jgi:hypothetical protein